MPQPTAAGGAGGRTCGVLLAAGSGRRMGGPKALLRHPDGTAWVTAAARALLAGGCADVVVVLGAGAEQAAALVPAAADVVVAAGWQEGMGASLRAGLEAVQARHGRAVAALVALVDTPGVSAGVVARMITTAAPGTLARAGYAGRAGHPVLLGRAHWAGVREQARGDSGARDYLAARVVQVIECGDLGHGDDLDTTAQRRARDGRDFPAAGAGGSAYPAAVSIQARPDPGRAHPALHPEHAGESLGGHPGHDTSRSRPPARRVALAAISERPLDEAAHEAAVADAAAGAVVTFHGTVRDHDGGRPVTAIEYVAHPSAADVLAEVAAQVAADSDCEAVAVTHRVGQLHLGEVAIVVAVSAAHRQQAFAAAALLVDEVKHRLPVWKRQQFPDGNDEWVACP